MAFCTTPASLDHFTMAYSLTTCFLVFTTQSARVRLRAASDILGKLCTTQQPYHMCKPNNTHVSASSESSA